VYAESGQTMECQLYDKDAGEDERLGMYVLTENE
jgi:hypothetical protein